MYILYRTKVVSNKTICCTWKLLCYSPIISIKGVGAELSSFHS